MPPQRTKKRRLKSHPVKMTIELWEDQTEEIRDRGFNIKGFVQNAVDEKLIGMFGYEPPTEE